MNLKNLLPAALAGLVATSTPSCNPAKALQEKEKERIQHVIRQVQPIEEDIQGSQKYYMARSDLQNISLEQQSSLILSHAKLTRLKNGLEDGSISFPDFYNTVVNSEARIITDQNTKLQIDFAGHNRNISVYDTSIEFWTSPWHSNEYLKNYHISDITMEGGELRIVVDGESYETDVTDDAAKQQWDINVSPNDQGVHPASKTLTIRLVLAK